MKKKINWEAISVIVAICVFAILISIMFLWYIESSYPMPNYTIYKNVCHNESKVVLTKYSEDRECYLRVGTHNCPRITYNEEVIYKEVCNKIEVKKVSLSEAWKICWKDNISEKAFVLCSTILDSNVPITKEWLDNNCEKDYIDESLCKKGEVIKRPDYVWPYCLRYKCGEYTVEIK